MNPPTENLADKPPSRKPRPWQLVTHGLLIALVLYTCYWAAKTVKRIVAGPQGAPVAQDAGATIEPTFQALANAPTPGYWVFANQTWAMAQTKLSPAEFEPHLLRRVDLDTESGPAQREFLQEFKSLGSPVALGDRAQLYRAGTAGGPFAVTRGQGDAERLVVAGIAMAGEEGSWQLLEMLPTPSTGDGTFAARESLLPLPPQAKRLMSRWSNEGTLLLDWARVPMPAEAIVRQWREAGLKLRATTGLLGAESSYLYERAGEVIIVNTFPSTEGGADLLITRSTDVVPSSEAGVSDRMP